MTVEGDVLKDIRFTGSGLRDLDRVGLDDDREPQGQDAPGGRGALHEVSRPDHRRVEIRPARQGPPLGKLEVFSGVREYPVRVKCATLPWHTLKAALASDGADTTVSTEDGAEASPKEEPKTC